MYIFECSVFAGSFLWKFFNKPKEILEFGRPEASEETVGSER